MRARLAIGALILALSIAAAGPCARSQEHAAAKASPPVSSAVRPPTEEEIRERREQLLAHQHLDDEELNLYERMERHTDRTGGPAPQVLAERTYRVVPTGGGTLKILVEDKGVAVTPGDYRRQLKTWQDVLEMMANPENPKARTALEKYQKRERDRAQFVEAAKDAFLPKWLAREAWHGRSCDVFELDPNPAFHPRTMLQEVFAHVVAKIWVDRDAVQIARAEAHVTSDISFGGGILGKLYQGSVISMEQEEVAPGVWLPARYEFGFAGRKFVFPFSGHQLIEVSHYRRVGPPQQALALVRSELASGKAFREDP